MTSRAMRSRRGTVAANVTALAVFVVFTFPVYWMVSSSLLPNIQLQSTRPTFVPIGGAVANYRAGLPRAGFPPAPFPPAHLAGAPPNSAPRPRCPPRGAPTPRPAPSMRALPRATPAPPPRVSPPSSFRLALSSGGAAPRSRGAGRFAWASGARPGPKRAPAGPFLWPRSPASPPDPPACDSVLAASVAAQAAAQVLMFIDRASPDGAVTNGTLELVLPGWQWRRRTWQIHPRCGCGRRGTS